MCASPQKNPLEFALEFEQKGVALYLRLAAETSNELGKKLFYTLAGDEVQHARKIDSMFGELKKKNGAAGLDTVTLPGVTELIKTFFAAADTAYLKKNVGNIEAYEIAMKMEREGYATYQEFSAMATSSQEKEFFNYLLSQEKEHIDAIANVYAYLTDIGDWLQEDESRTWNWMNI